MVIAFAIHLGCTSKPLSPTCFKHTNRRGQAYLDSSATAERRSRAGDACAAASCRGAALLPDGAGVAGGSAACTGTGAALLCFAARFPVAMRRLAGCASACVTSSPFLLPWICSAPVAASAAACSGEASLPRCVALRAPRWCEAAAAAFRAGTRARLPLAAAAAGAASRLGSCDASLLDASSIIASDASCVCAEGASCSALRRPLRRPGSGAGDASR
jgi:hypothetical protein